MAPARKTGWMRSIPTYDNEVTMTLHPKTFTDMMLAPVAAEIDLNLQRLRDKTPVDVDYELGLVLDRPPLDGTRDERADFVLRAALRNVDCHGWEATITDDGCRLHLSGGSVSLDLGLGDTVMRYIDGGKAAEARIAPAIA
jgi:hypothetical protein